MFLDSTTVVHPAVNRTVEGSNPSPGANWPCSHLVMALVCKTEELGSIPGKAFPGLIL